MKYLHILNKKRNLRIILIQTWTILVDAQEEAEVKDWQEQLYHQYIVLEWKVFWVRYIWDSKIDNILKKSLKKIWP